MPDWKEAIKFFLGRYLSGYRGMSENTIESYAKALELWTTFRKRRGTPSTPEETSVQDVLAFLNSLQEHRGNGVPTRNLRWAALQCFWKSMKLLDPQNDASWERLLTTPKKRTVTTPPDSLDVREVKHLFSLMDVRTTWGFQHSVLFRYAYNTGSRISELAEAKIDWLRLSAEPEVMIRGKGGRLRVCPLWESTAQLLKVYLDQERPRPRVGHEGSLFLSRQRRPWTRKGLWWLMASYFERAQTTLPSLEKKLITPHSIRHSTAMHLLQSGVDVTVVKAWLGHKQVSTTMGYLDLDLTKKREALDKFLKLDIERLVGNEPETRAVLPASVIDWVERM
jgi:site-specific recombinase XerD